MNIRPPQIGPQPWEQVRGKLDQSLPFANMRDTPYYRDAVWEQFSKAEYERRYRALREKMREHKLDVVIRSEEHTSELQSQFHLVCRLLLEKKKKKKKNKNKNII